MVTSGVGTGVGVGGIGVSPGFGVGVGSGVGVGVAVGVGVKVGVGCMNGRSNGNCSRYGAIAPQPANNAATSTNVLMSNKLERLFFLFTVFTFFPLGWAELDYS